MTKPSGQTAHAGQEVEPLTEQEEQFCWEYVGLGGRMARAGARAYLRVNPTVTPGSAQVLAHRLLRRVNVAARVAQLQQELADAAQVSTRELDARLEAIAIADLRDVAVWDRWRVQPKPSAELLPEAAAAISEVSQRKDGVTVKLHDPIRARRLLAELRGELHQTVALSGEVQHWVVALPDKLSPDQWRQRFARRGDTG
jgi:phage terminase small subunit